MVKITIMGAGSTGFCKKVVGDIMLSPVFNKFEIALYDIDAERLKESELVVSVLNKNLNEGRAAIKSYAGVEKRKDALRSADFVINTIQIGGYDPCTITDFEIPKKYGLLQTIGDTTGIGGIMRALRTIPVMEDFARDMEEVCPDALFLNYTNPMSMLSGYMLRYTPIKYVGLCHSVQVCAKTILTHVNMKDKIDGVKAKIAGINHMAWLLEIYDRDGNDLYPEIRRRAKEKNENEIHADMARFEYINKLGYYCTESSEHNSEYNCFFIKNRYPEFVEKYNLKIDEYPRRCIQQIKEWNEQRDSLLNNGELTHEMSIEYVSHIMEAIVSNSVYEFAGNVLNTGGLIGNLPEEACVEVPCLVNGMGIHPTFSGRLPVQLAAMNMTNINVHLCTIEAARTHKKEHIYHAAMLDPHTSAELSLDDIVKMVDELLEAHGDWMPKFN